MKPPVASSRGCRAARAPRGFALITSLLMLVVVTLLALGMFRSLGVQEKIAGNTMEKQRSLQAAESALQYAEWWLSQGNSGSAVNCTAAYNANVVVNMQVCSNGLTASSARTLPWSARGDYMPPNMTVSSSGGLVASGANAGDINYFAKPSLYIQYLGLGPDGKSQLYQVTGAGYGGSANGASVVQSTYALAYSNPPLDNP